MASRNKTAGKSHNQQLLTKRSINFWVIGGLLLFFFLIMPFQRGLLNVGDPTFEIPILYSFIIGAVLLLSLAIHMYQSRAASIVETPYHFLIWSIPFIYFISMFGAASAHYSYIEFLVWILYATFFTVAYYFSSQKDGRNAAFYIFMGTAAVIVLFGMMNWFGDAALWGLLPWKVYKDAAMFASGDIRLTSIFQYANSYAAYLIAFIFACLATVIFSKNKYIVLFASFMFIPAFISFILTLSRGGWLAFPIILLLILPLISFSKQIQALFHFVLGAVVSVAILPYINSVGLKLQVEHTQWTALSAWIVLIGVSMVAAVISIVFQKNVAPKIDGKLERWNKHKFNNLFLPVLTILVGLIGVILLFSNSGILKILPDNIESRLENINFNQHSVLERGTFYQDTIAIWKDYPIAGAGGGAWQALYEKYQNNPYTSVLAHSYFFQMLAEVGTLGMLALFIVLITVYYRFIRSFAQKKDEDKLVPYVWFIVSTSILVHSVLDFNMSYVYLAALVFFALGGMLAATDTKTFDWQQKLLRTNWRFATPILLVAGSLAFFITALVNISGYNAYQSAQKSIHETTVQQALSEIDQAIERGGHPEYVDFKLQVLNHAYEQSFEEQYATEAQRTLDEIIKNEPYYESFIYRQIDLNTLLQNDEASISLLETSFNKFPWEINLYEQFASIQFRRSINALSHEDEPLAKQLLQTVIDLRDKVMEKTLVLEQLPEDQLQGREFGITPTLALTVGQTFYVLGDYEQAVSYLATAWNPAFTEQKDVTAAIYYSSAMKRLNLPYEEVDHALFTAFPDQQENLQQDLAALGEASPLSN